MYDFGRLYEKAEFEKILTLFKKDENSSGDIIYVNKRIERNKVK